MSHQNVADPQPPLEEGVRDKEVRRPPRKESIWRMVLPRSLLNLREPGNPEVWAMALLCVARVFLMNWMSQLVGGLDHVMMTRDQQAFWKLWRHSFVAALLSAAHRQTYKYYENRLGAVWRQKLTLRLFSKYFDNNRYYTMGSAQQGALTTSTPAPSAASASSSSSSSAAGSKRPSSRPRPPVDAVSDPDERMVNDVRDVSLDMAFAACEAMYAATAGVFFAAKLGRIYGARYALAPYFYLISGVVLSQKLMPVNWGKFRGEARDAESDYQRSLERVEASHEPIRALRGEQNEKQQLLDKFSRFVGSLKRLDVLGLKTGFVDQLLFMWWLRTFVGAFVIGPHALRRDLGTDSIASLAQLRGDLGHQFVLFVQSVVSAGVVAKMLRQLQKIAGSAGRIERLDAKLNEIKAREDADSADGSRMEEGDAIAFDGVDVVTPTGVLLIKNLSFRLEYGESLLLTGANGRGKSSVFRCLGGLWKARKGSISKPGGGSSHGLADDVFFLPQKPYCAIGSLSDQIQYPKVGAAALSEQVLLKLLKRVGLAQIMTRPIKDHEWDSVLSLGEKQRLQIARLIFHKPKYCILDEVTSALPHSMERRLYALMARQGISFISISHRPILRSFHSKILTIGLDDAGGYTLEDNLENDLQSLKDSNVESLLEGDSSANSDEDCPVSMIVPQSRIKAAPGKKLDGTIWTRLKRLMVIGAPRGLKSQLFGYVIGTVVQSQLLIQHTLVAADMMGCVFSRASWAERRRNFFKLVLKGVLLSVGMAAVEQGIEKSQANLKLGIQERLAKNLTERYLSQGRFFDLMQFRDGGISDPAQRIGRDVPDFAAQLTGLLPLIKPLIEVSFLGHRIFKLVGAKVSSSFVLYLAVGTFILKKLLPNFEGLITREKELEGKYKLVHTRCKTHAEAIAFHGGDRREKEIAENLFFAAAKATGRRLQNSMSFGIFNQAIVREAPMLVQWILRNEYSKQWFASDADVAKDAGQKLNSDQLFLYSATNYTFEALGNLLGAVEKVATLSAVVARVFELDQALLALPKKSLEGPSVGPADEIAVKGLSITTPDGGKNSTLVREIDLTVRRGEGLIVTGPTGCGKSSFGRILCGLWPKTPSSATLQCPSGPDGPKIYLVPQKLYMCQGSLADQVSYPQRLDPKTRPDAELQSVLDLCGIGYLSSRNKDGWDTVMPWEDCLSLGEQQRLSLARLFFHRPDFEFCILDDSTNAVSQEAERQLYQIASTKFGFTCITISDRLALPEFHAWQLDLLGDGSMGYEHRRSDSVHEGDD